MREVMRTIGVADADAAPAGNRRSTYLWWVIWLVWTPLFVPTLIGFIQAHPPLASLIVSLAGVALFFALYLRTTWQNAEHLASATPRARPTGAALWTPVAVMIALSVIFVPVNGPQWGAMFIYTSACAAGRLPTRQAAITIAGLVAFTLVGVSLNGSIAAAISSATFVAIPGFVVAALVQSIGTSQQLRAVREEMARSVAVSEERLRIARDLHDLLGHNLSVIALKSELARRLVSVAPERAAAEIGDVENVARTALQEVREAVAGYRQPSLAVELAGAREVLSAAGIAFRYEGDEGASGGLPTAIDTTLAWAVREGVTNVIRHSHARSCTISVTQSLDEVRVEIADDGTRIIAADTADAPTGMASGNGLRGLGERVVALGGHYTAGPRATGGFCLSASVPLQRSERLVAAPSTPPSLQARITTPVVSSATSERANDPATQSR